MKEAILKAIEGGWRPELPKFFLWTKPMDVYVAGKLFSIHFITQREGAIKESIIGRVNDAVNDHLFWVCLGIGLGNKEEMRCDSPRCETKQCEYAGYKDPKRMYESYHETAWWHKTRWYEIGIEDFFKNILR